MTSVERNEVERRLERFIAEELLEEHYDGRDPLATEAVDSLGLEQLLAYIEEEFGVALEDEEIGEGFASIPTLAALIVAKQQGARR